MVPHTTGSQRSAYRFSYSESPRNIFRENSPYRLLRGVNALRVAYYSESKLPASFTSGSHCYLRGVDPENLKDSPPLVFKETILQKLIYTVDVKYFLRG